MSTERRKCHVEQVRLGKTLATLDEGAYAWAPPWHLYLVRVAGRGTPGRRTQLAVATAHPALTRQIVMHSANLIARGKSSSFDDDGSRTP